ncbi:hypothetical protein IFM89_027706, partial [Coptis chinensis]
QGYFGVHDPSGQVLQQTCTVYMESLYATVGETLTDQSLTTEEKIYVLASNMSWSLRLTFKELLEENTRILYVTRSKGLMMPTISQTTFGYWWSSTSALVLA